MPSGKARPGFSLIRPKEIGSKHRVTRNRYRKVWVYTIIIRPVPHDDPYSGEEMQVHPHELKGQRHLQPREYSITPGNRVSWKRDLAIIDSWRVTFSWGILPPKHGPTRRIPSRHACSEGCAQWSPRFWTFLMLSHWSWTRTNRSLSLTCQSWAFLPRHWEYPLRTWTGM